MIKKDKNSPLLAVRVGTIFTPVEKLRAFLCESVKSASKYVAIYKDERGYISKGHPDRLSDFKSLLFVAQQEWN